MYRSSVIVLENEGLSTYHFFYFSRVLFATSQAIKMAREHGDLRVEFELYYCLMQVGESGLTNKN